MDNLVSTKEGKKLPPKQCAEKGCRCIFEPISNRQIYCLECADKRNKAQKKLHNDKIKSTNNTKIFNAIDMLFALDIDSAEFIKGNKKITICKILDN